MRKKKTIPSKLTGEAKAFYQRIVDKYDLTDAGIQLLEVAAFTLQRMFEAKALIDKEGIVQGGKSMNRLHPAVKCEHDARLSFCRFLKELNLDSELENL